MNIAIGKKRNRDGFDVLPIQRRPVIPADGRLAVAVGALAITAAGGQEQEDGREQQAHCESLVT